MKAQGTYKITGHTGLLCLLGSPVEHSLSPEIHNYSLEKWGLPYCYLAFSVEKEELPTVLGGLKALHFRGANLTMPLKNAVLPYCDTLSREARLSGAVNTLVFEGGKLHGYTTDGLGFLLALQAEGISCQGKKLLLLGAGGAGTSVLVAAALHGFSEIVVFLREESRTREKVGRLSEKLEQEGVSCGIRISGFSEEEIKKSGEDAAVLLNTTNVGMQDDATLIPDFSVFPRDMLVADAIYANPETRMLRDAGRAGYRTMNGVPMLLYQAAEAFRLFTGREMLMEKELLEQIGL